MEMVAGVMSNVKSGSSILIYTGRPVPQQDTNKAHPASQQVWCRWGSVYGISDVSGKSIWS